MGAFAELGMKTMNFDELDEMTAKIYLTISSGYAEAWKKKTSTKKIGKK